MKIGIKMLICQIFYENLYMKSQVLMSFHTESDASSDAAMRQTEKLEYYIFQWFFHTAALRVQCEYIIEIHVYYSKFDRVHFF